MAITLQNNSSTLTANLSGVFDSANPDGTGTSGGTPALAWSSARLSNGATMTITTDGTNPFGTSTATGLYDIGDRVIEKGVDNNYHSTFTDGQNVYGSDVAKFGGNADVDAIYAEPNTAAGGYDFLQIDRSSPQRHQFVDSHYYDASEGGFVGFPSVFGGSVPESGHTKLYSAWRLKLNWNFYALHFFSYGSKSGSFTLPVTDKGVGESLTLDSGDAAQIIYDDGTNIGFYTPDKTDTNLNTLNGTVVTGVSSGATVTLTSTDEWGGAEKIQRIGDEAGAATVGTWNQYGGQSGTPSVLNAKIWTLMNQQEWALMESLYDKTALTWDVYINGTKLWGLTGIDQTFHGTNSLVFTSIGWQSVRTLYNVVEFGEIYAGFDFKRVYFGDAATWGACTKREIQIVNTWANTQIEIEQYQGELSSVSGSYLYVSDTYPSDPDSGVLMS